MSAMPVYSIRDFEINLHEVDFYANTLKRHLLQHPMTAAPHKHDFYVVALFTTGTGKHEIDFVEYSIKPGQLYIMSPGQMHNWSCSPDADGFVFFHSKDFYEKGEAVSGLKNFPFFDSTYSASAHQLTKKNIHYLTPFFKSLILEYPKDNLLKFEKIHALITLIYIEAARAYAPVRRIENVNYLQKLRTMESMIDLYYKSKKYPHEYASLLNMSEKHLNRIIKETLNKTTSVLIAERIILEAKRLLIHSPLSIKQIAIELGYEDYSYFSRFFKKHTGKTPQSFQGNYK
ncbi:MAG: helix-turn-helix protein [Bacteroidota bacterium]|jgi:AraC-like DNA-binding protein|nr:helix-turn-helix protein [Bacteroidota bacterium]